jgi:hypothetical protein
MRHIRKGPLKKVVGGKMLGTGIVMWGKEVTAFHEELECGHFQRPVTDMIGETHAYRRRCWQCRKGLPIAPTPGRTEGK